MATGEALLIVMHYYRHIIRIRAEDSPNVRAQCDDALPGVLSYSDYVYRRKTWDEMRQCIGLDAKFYKGPTIYLFPEAWLIASATNVPHIVSVKSGLCMGVDPGEGDADTVWCIGNRQGVHHMEAFKTPDTSIIPTHTVGLLQQWNIDPSDCIFDRGGGGKEHADYLRKIGYNVRTVAFGEQVTPEPALGMKEHTKVIDEKETHYEFKNRRAQMYGEVRELINPNRPDGDTSFFAIPDGPDQVYKELRRQLSPIPLWRDEEGRLYLPPKNRKPSQKDGTGGITLIDIVGCSPDEADALVLMVHAVLHPEHTVIAGMY